MTSPRGSRPDPPEGTQPPAKISRLRIRGRRLSLIVALVVTATTAALMENVQLPVVEHSVAAGPILSDRSEPEAAHHHDLGELLLAKLRRDNDLSGSRHDFISSAGSGIIPMQGCQGKCLDPHPGQFQAWNGQQNGCWVQVWRRWPEGCQHYQWYNACNGYWDSYPNGAPKVFWTCCVH